MEPSAVVLTLVTFLLVIVNIGTADAKREIKYSDQWNRENFIQHDFYTPDINDEPKDQGVSLELLRAKLEELMNEEAQDFNEDNGRSTILSNIRGRPTLLGGIREQNKQDRQGLIQLIWEWLFGTGTTTTAAPTDGSGSGSGGSGSGGSGSGGSGSGSGGSGSGSGGSGSGGTTAPPNRTRRPTKYKNRGYCKNPPKTHLPENDPKEDD